MKLSIYNLSRAMAAVSTIVIFQIAAYSHGTHLHPKDMRITTDSMSPIKSSEVEIRLMAQGGDSFHNDNTDADVESQNDRSMLNAKKAVPAKAIRFLLKSLVITLVEEEYGAHCELCGGPHPYGHDFVCGGSGCMLHPEEDCRRAVVV